MVDNVTALQQVIRDAVARSGKARDHFDSLIQQRTGTKGKPIYDIDRGKSKAPSIDTLRLIASALDLPLQALTHPGIAPTPDQPPTRSSDAGETVEIMELDLSVAMGVGTLIEDFVESEPVSFDAARLRRITRTPSDRLRFITGIGTSHEPRFNSGDQFLIDINDRRLTRIDGYYWITFDGAHALKRLRPIGNGMVRIISENPAYEPMDVPAEDVRIEGRAIWFARSL